MQTLIIVQEGKRARTIKITEQEYDDINAVDYLELDAAGKLIPEFECHGEEVFAAMNQIIARIQ